MLVQQYQSTFTTVILLVNFIQQFIDRVKLPGLRPGLAGSPNRPPGAFKLLAGPQILIQPGDQFLHIKTVQFSSEIPVSDQCQIDGQKAEIEGVTHSTILAQLSNSATE